MTFLKKIDTAHSIIKDALKTYPNISVGCSFGKDSMVTLHLVKTINPHLPVFSIMANTEFDETYAFAQEVNALWNLDYTEHRFSQDNAKCCGAPKVKKTKEALKDYDAWISGVRRTEGITRANFEPIEEKNGLVKINPILDFTEVDIWRYTALYNLPVHKKYAQGYRSLGCSLCSFPEEDEHESERAGRWKGTDNACGECGIHTQPLR